MTSIFKPQQPFGQTNAWDRQNANSLQYNTSIAGSVVNLVYGTCRVAVNLIGFGNYQGPQGKKGKVGPLPITGTNPGKGQVGKGGGSGGKKGVTGKKSNSFSIDVAFGVCQGPVTIGSNNKAFVSAAWTEFSQSQLNLYTGTDGQAEDSTMVGLGQNVGYSGTCYVTGTPMDLGSTPALPNIQLEVSGFFYNTGGTGSVDADPAQAVLDFLTNSRYGAGFPSANVDPNLETIYGVYCVAAQIPISTILDSQRQAHEWLSELARLTNTAIVWSGSILKFIPYGDLTVTSPDGTLTWQPNLTPQYSLNDDDFLPWEPHFDINEPQIQDDPVLLTRTNPADAINWLTIEYLDRSNFYNPAVLAVFDQGAINQYGIRSGENLRGHCFTNAISAQISAQLLLQRLLYIRNSYKFKVGWQFSLLEPMDIVLITDFNLGLTGQAVRILSIEEDENGDLTIEAEEIVIGTPSAQSQLLAFDNSGNGKLVVKKAYPIPPYGPPSVVNNLLSFTISTNYSSDVILVFVSAEVETGPSPMVSGISSTTGLNFTLRKREQDTVSGFNSNGFSGTFNTDVEIWWAPTTSQLTNEQITIQFSSPVRSGVAYGAAFTGVNPAVPFDSNVSLPTVAKNLTSTASIAEVSGVSTTNPNDILVAFFVNYNNPTITESLPPSPGFFWIEPQINADILVSGSNLLGSWNQANAQYEVVSATQSSITVLSGGTGENVASWIGIVDALTAG